MKKLFKWPGGKSRELKIIKNLLPDNFDTVVEPFAGSAAVAFDFEKPCVLNDLDQDVINLYNVVQDPEMFQAFYSKALASKTIPFVGKMDPQRGSVPSLETEFYDQRDILNERDFSDPVKMAYAFLVIRQLCFSGMLRHNKNSGRFNVPYGWYKKFAHNVTPEHHDFLSKSVIMRGDYKDCIKKYDVPGAWIFVDPPYRKRAGYPAETWNDELHIELAETLKNCKHAKFMLVHCEDDLYRELYKDFTIISKDFNYSIAFRDRNVDARKVNHLYIVNY